MDKKEEKKELQGSKPAVEADKDAKVNPTFGTLKTGEYMVHVFIEETRALVNPTEDDATVDCIIRLECFGDRKYSSVKKGLGSGAQVWNEHFFFNDIISNAYELERQNVVITVSNHKLIGTDAKLGSIEIDFSTVYATQKHTIFHRWAALANFEKKNEKVLGFIKFSISIIKEGDPTEQLSPEDLGAAFDPKNVMMPPYLETKLHQLTVNVHRGEHIKKMDTFGTVDGYIIVKFGAVEIKTDVKNNTQSPTWQNVIKLPITLPSVNDVLHLQLMDYDTGKSDELIGSCHIKIADLLAKNYERFHWMNFYSSPPDASGKYKDLMNTIPALASFWCGRVQLSITLQENKNAVGGKFPMTDQKTINALIAEQQIKWELRAEAHWAMNLPENEKEYGLVITWGPTEQKIASKKVPKGRMCEWYQSITPITANFATRNAAELPDVFVFLVMNNKERYSYVRYPSSYFTNQSAKPEIFYFKIDKSVSKIRDDLAGVVKFKLWLHAPSESTNYSIGGWDKELKKKPEMKKWKVIVNLYQAQDLIAADDDGSSDPICEIYFSGWIFKSKPIENTLNPVWNFRMEFQAEFDSFEDCPPFLLTVWDYDEYDANDYLGSVGLKIDESMLEKVTPVTPQWHNLKYGTLDKDFGKVLISFNVYPAHITKIPYGEIDPPTTKHFLNMKVLGVRGLKSLGIMDVKKPYVVFDLNSIRAPGQKQLAEEKKIVKTQPKEPGPNANILTVINLELDLPIDPLYCPSLSCRVHDHYLSGIAQPLLGIFSIPLGEFLKRTAERLTEEKKEQSAIFANVLAGKKGKSKLVSGNLNTTGESQITTSKIDLEMTANVISPKSQTKSKSKDDPQDPDLVKLINSVVVRPVYKFDKLKGYDVEQIRPDPNLYMAIGYDSKDRKEKHYRRSIEKTLEKSDYMDESPFDEIPIKRGAQVDDDKLFAKIFGKKKENDVHESENVGFFKAMITIMTKEQKEKNDNGFFGKIKDSASNKFSDALGIPDLDFLKKVNCVVRVYVINCGNLAAKDENSNSDPYLKLILGEKTIDDSKYFFDNEPDPDFYKLYELPATLPGAGLLRIQVYDKDDFKSDDLIGETQIDVEDRWFSKKFRMFDEVPIERRELYNPVSSVSQGCIRLWVDIIPREENTIRNKYNITKKPPKKFEIRMIVWDCQDIPLVDSDGSVDIYISGRLDDGTTLKTDTHWRSMNGRGSFNWRMIFPVTFPMKSHRISIQAWDKDIMSGNDYIGEATLDFTKEADEAFLHDRSVKMYGKDEKDKMTDKFTITCQKAKDGKLEATGKIKISFQMVPEEEAVLNKVGQGRSDPNQDPYLPPPVGRIQFSLNPLKMWEQYIGPVYRRRVYMFCCLACYIALCVFSLPTIIGTEISKIIP